MGLPWRIANKVAHLACSVSTRRSYVKDDFEKALLYDCVSSAIAKGSQVESRLYSKKIFNSFPSVRFTFSGPNVRVPKCNLPLVSALRACGVVYDRNRLRPKGSDGDQTSAISVGAWQMVKQCSSALSYRERILDVIVPVYNNGIFLITKCLPSLAANAIWEQMRVIVVDDASDDPVTQEILDEVKGSVGNVDVVRLEGPPSGSASGPRNVGIELAKSDLVTFLDPDNEISVGGYDELVKQFYGSSVPVQMASGYQLKVGASIGLNARNALFHGRLVDRPSALFTATQRFPVVSTQAAVISRVFLEDNKIRYVEGAVGQDTLFGWEILLNANAILFCHRPFIVYYSQRSGSITNDAGVDYFRRALIREKAQFEVLRQAGILSIYRKNQLPRMMDEIYKPKLDNLDGPGRDVAEGYVQEICGLYAL